MHTADFDFDLPQDLIANRPADPRDSARLLVLGDPLTGRATGGLDDRIVRDLPGLLRPGDRIVVNDTRVIPARLRGMRGAVRIELLLHQARPDGTWLAFARPGKRLKADDRIAIGPDASFDVLEKRESGEIVVAFGSETLTLAQVLADYGEMPLPPYIRRARGGDARDHDDYQTLFAKRDGAVAAPTAGLHFTPDLLRALAEAGIDLSRITLHVGAGTFLPVKAERVADHRMHAEFGEVTEEAAQEINRTREAGGRIVAVGTTVLRLLETVADHAGVIAPWTGETDIFITPGYRFKVVDLLMTNFHLPQSTLFMLVCAFAGTENMRAAYAHAIERRYRFYSYGDGSLLVRAGDRDCGGDAAA